MAGHPVEAWQAKGRWIPVEDHQVFVVDVPAKDEQEDPVLVLHGFPSSSLDWRHVVTRLAERRRVVLFDFLGFGLSDKPDRPYGIRLHADVAEAVAEATQLERVALVSHDMGDTVAGELLARDLESELTFEVARTVVTNGSIYLDLARLTDGQTLLWGLPDERFDPVAMGLDPEEGYRAGLAGTFSPDHPPDEDELDAQWVLTSRNDGFGLLPRTIRYLDDRQREESRFTGALETHPAPLGVVWGEVDPIAVLAMTDRLLERRPDTPRVVLPGVGHYPMIEAPTEFADAVLGYLG